MQDIRAMTSAEQVFSRTDSCTMGFRFRFWHRAVNADEAERQLCKFEAKWLSILRSHGSGASTGSGLFRSSENYQDPRVVSG